MAKEEILTKITYKEFCALMNRYERSKFKHEIKEHENKFKYKRVFDKNKGK
jgi:hypothetical protein